MEVEMILLDDKHGRIQATIKKDLLATYRQQISEGKVYTFQKIFVSEPTNKLKTTRNQYKLFFMKNTMVEKISDEGISKFAFNFVSFDSILNKENELFISLKNTDVIGHVVENEKIREIVEPDKIMKLITFVLEDMELNDIGSYAQIITQLSGPISMSDEFLLTKRIIVKEQSISPEVGLFTMLTRIIEVESIENWYYEGCTIFKMQVRVRDRIGATSLMLFDRMVKLLISKSATDLINPSNKTSTKEEEEEDVDADLEDTNREDSDMTPTIDKSNKRKRTMYIHLMTRMIREKNQAKSVPN
ncbi:uncharacterized protein [Rutidosis leptorrhynchoides]|uniref:uncharacterized protein n=1 Tax=Rutidosis leptorrhynchoides TaxID=125765 RepID=UPI003A99C9BC